MSKHLSHPVVSIILRTFNRANYLTQSTHSVLDQSWQDWELIIVDDGSTDDSEKIIQSFLADSRITCCKQTNQGQAQAFNHGFKKARGDYITLLDSDDEYKKNHIETRVILMRRHPQIDIIHGGVQIMGNRLVPDKHDLTKKIHLKHCPIGATFFAKRHVFATLKGFKDTGYSEDSDFLKRAQQKKFVIKKIDKQTYIYHRDTPGSVCNRISTADCSRTDRIHGQSESKF